MVDGINSSLFAGGDGGNGEQALKANVSINSRVCAQS